MNSHHQLPELYYDQTISRPSATQRHQQQQNLHRQSSRQFDTYGQIPNGLFRPDDHSFRYDSTGFGGMNTGIPPAGFNYDHPSSQTWNPNAFTGNGGFSAFGATGRMKPATRGRTGLPTVCCPPFDVVLQRF